MLNLGTRNLNPNWVTGFTDAEGCFTVDIFDKYHPRRSEWRFIPCFQIELHIRDLNLLLDLKSYFNGAGNISTRSNRDSANYRIRDLKSIIDIVIPHFDKYPLISQKCSDYTLFKEIIKIMENKEHLTSDGIIKIVNLSVSLNRGLSREVELAFSNVKGIPRSKVILPEEIDYNWLAGFISGDGCFYVNISKSSTCTLGYSVKLWLSLTQHVRDKLLLNKISQTLGCGTIYKHGEHTVVFRVESFKDISSIVIPIFEKFPIKGIRHLDFKDFCLISSMVQDKMHLTRVGLDNIRSIKSGMNSGRKC